MTDNDDTTYADLVGFLQSDRQDLREAAAEAALAVASDTRNNNNNQSITQLLRHNAIPHLTRLITHPGRVGYASLSCLVYLTSSFSDDITTNNAVCEEVLSSKGLNRAAEVGLSYEYCNDDAKKSSSEDEEARKHVNHAMALLSNLTRTERGARELLLPSDKRDLEVSNVSSKVNLLVDRFLSKRYIRDCGDTNASSFLLNDENDDDETTGLKDPYQHIASVLRNMTQIEAGRKFVTSHHHHPTDRILPPMVKSLLLQLRCSPNRIRRRGAAGTLKHCCFDSNRSKLWIFPLATTTTTMSSIDDDVIVSLLYPLAGPEKITSEEERLLIGQPLVSLLGPEKVRERDGETRLLIVDTIVLLCAAGRRVRDIMRAKGTYVILRNADLVEEEKDVMDRIEECVQFLRRDEEGMKEGSSDEVAVELAKKIHLRRSDDDNEGGEEEDYDDVD